MPAGEAEKTYFSSDGIDLEKIAAENPGYTRVFMNARKRGSTTVISLTRDRGDRLYIVSNISHERISDYFKYREGEVVAGESVDVPGEAEEKPKRKKQSNLLGFLGGGSM
jgi:hypothetical protein